MAGPYQYSNATQLDGLPMVGTHQCVALVQFYAHAPQTTLWRKGSAVRGSVVEVGTAIATFVGDTYPNYGSGNHAALYLSQDSSGIWVVDQWAGKPGGLISKRHIQFRGGDNANRSNDGDAYSVIK